MNGLTVILAVVTGWVLGVLVGAGAVVWVWSRASGVRQTLVTDYDAEIPSGVSDHELLVCVSCPNVPGECPRCPLGGLGNVPLVGHD